MDCSDRQGIRLSQETEALITNAYLTLVLNYEKCPKIIGKFLLFFS